MMFLKNCFFTFAQCALEYVSMIIKWHSNFLFKTSLTLLLCLCICYSSSGFIIISNLLSMNPLFNYYKHQSNKHSLNDSVEQIILWGDPSLSICISLSNSIELKYGPKAASKLIIISSSKSIKWFLVQKSRFKLLNHIALNIIM